MFQLQYLWYRLCSLVGKKPETAAPQAPTEPPQEEKPAVKPADKYTPPPMPKTIADIVKQETPKPQKKPRKPRAKKIPPSPEIVKVYADKAPEADAAPVEKTKRKPRKQKE